MKLAIATVLLSGCSAIFGLEPPVRFDAATGDGPKDGTGDSGDPQADARICTAPPNCTAFACGGSPSCYFVCTPTTSWSGAVTSCTSRGACLVTIDSQAEQDCVINAANPGFPEVVWLGWSQSASGVEPAGGWSWQCGSSGYLAPNWGGSEPNNSGGNEDCGAMATGGAWVDFDCATNERFACEIP